MGIRRAAFLAMHPGLIGELRIQKATNL